MDPPSPRRYHRHNFNSPNSSTSSTNSNGAFIINQHHQQHNQLPPTLLSVAAQAPPPPPPLPPRPMFRSRISEVLNLYPTTFVQTDTDTFKQVVQMLTGCNDTARVVTANAATIAREREMPRIPRVRTIMNMNNRQHQELQSGFKLYERRSNNLNINPLLPNNVNVGGGGNVRSTLFPSTGNNHLLHHHHHQGVVSPSIMDFPSLVLSPVTPLMPDLFGRCSSAVSTAAAIGGVTPVLKNETEAEDRAIKGKGFYFHPSPHNTTPRDAEPRLLPLFPTAASPTAAPSAPPPTSSSA